MMTGEHEIEIDIERENENENAVEIALTIKAVTANATPTVLHTFKVSGARETVTTEVTEIEMTVIIDTGAAIERTTFS